MLCFLILLVASLFTAPVWYDDTGHFRVVAHLVEIGEVCYPLGNNGAPCIKHSPFITMGPALQYPAAVWMQIFGVSMRSARVFIVLISFVFSLVFWLLARSLTRKEKAFWALLLVIGNIQLLTYGAQFLGETPMLMWLFLGFGLQITWLKRGGIWFPMLTALCWAQAVAIKEYIILPLGLSLILFLLWSIRRKDLELSVNTLMQGLFLPLVMAGLWWMTFDNRADFMAFWEQRSAYGSEFFSFTFLEPLRFLFFKPLIWLGTIALILKIKTRKNEADIFIGIFHIVHLIWFLLSAGYDRFGFQLLFIPAIYLSEFLLFAWQKTRISKYPGLLRLTFILGFLLFFTQRTFPILAERLLNPEQINDTEKQVATWLGEMKIERIFTYDEQIVTFLPKKTNYRLQDKIPALASKCQALQLVPGEVLIAGDYARTVYEGCFNGKRAVVLQKFEGRGQTYEALLLE